MKNLPLSLALAAFSGAFTLQRPDDWSPRVRRAYVLVPGAVVAAIAVPAVRNGARKAAKEQAGSGTADLVTPTNGGPDDGASPAGTGSAGGPGETAEPAPPMPALALAAAVSGTTVSGLLALSLILDRGIEAWLVRRGVVHPRRVMAAIAALSSLVLDQAMDFQDAKKAARQSS